MKRNLKYVLSLLCAFALIITASPCFAITALAAEKDDNLVFSEYEYITSVREMSDDEIDAAALTVSEVQMLRSNAIEDELLARKELPDSELVSRYGYTYDEILILRGYNGGRIEEHPELAAITGTLTISKPTVLSATSSRIGVKVVWSWDHCPVVNANDVFAMYWDPTFGSKDGKMRINAADSTHTVRYNLYNTYVDFSREITQVSPNSAAKSVFSIQDQSGEAWAETGTLKLYFDATAGSAALTELDFIFAYGHAVLSVSPSVSFPASGGISFGVSTDDAGRRSGYITVASGKWYDN